MHCRVCYLFNFDLKSAQARRATKFCNRNDCSRKFIGTTIEIATNECHKNESPVSKCPLAVDLHLPTGPLDFRTFHRPFVVQCRQSDDWFVLPVVL